VILLYEINSMKNIDFLYFLNGQKVQVSVQAFQQKTKPCYWNKTIESFTYTFSAYYLWVLKNFPC